jgi:DNA-binding transcriptional ArsR family regulator
MQSIVGTNSKEMKMLSVLFPEVRANVLGLLFAAPRRELHLRELARQCRLAFRTVQVEVRKLAAAGLLSSRREGNRRYLRANTTSPHFADLQRLVVKMAAPSRKAK